MKLSQIRQRDNAQRGQVLPIFALMALVIVGAVALAVDFGFLTDQHRNLQTFADNAAIAGAEQLSPDGASAAKGRKSAMIYIRDNLKAGFTTDQVCGGDYTRDITNCVLPSPYNNYTVTIKTPGEWVSGLPYNAQTLEVKISDVVANTAAGVLGISSTTVSAGAEAKSQPSGQYLPTALYTDGCINTSSISVPILVDGDIYLNQCTVKPALAGGFCAATTPNAGGNIIFGPEAFPPGNILSGQNLANCQAQLLGIVAATGRVKQVPSAILPPPLPGPPQGPSTCNATDCNADHLCKNGTVKSDGSIPRNCYDPGVYSNGTDLGSIKNNLNPGVYYVDVSSGSCYDDPDTTSCGGVYFQGNTMNANLNNVINKCWAPLNVPSANTFASPCPNGIIVDPTLTGAVTDPQCAVLPAVLAANPALMTVAAVAGGSIPAGTYSVKVSTFGGTLINSTTSFESAATSLGTVTTSGANKRIQVKIDLPGVLETNGYNVYVGPVGQEQLVQHVNHPVLPPTVLTPLTVNIDNLAPANAQHYSLFDNSYCALGFHNIPHSKDASQNFGVTFVLTGKAGICMGSNPGGQYCTPSVLPSTVLLSPYCASGFTPNPESATCANAASEDGAYAVYGNTLGAIRTSGLLSYLNMSGTVYMPRGTLQEDLGSRFSLTPGQMVLHDANLSIGTSLLNPVVYYAPTGAVIPPSVTLIQ